MDIKLEQLDGTRFALELPAAGELGPRRLGIDKVVDLGGALRTQPGLLELKGARAEVGTVDAFSWPIGRGSLTLAAPAELSSVKVDLAAPLRGSRLPLELDARLGHVDAGALRLELPNLLLATSLQGSAIEVKHQEKELVARAATARTTDLQLSSAGVLLRGALSVSGLRLHLGEGAISGQASTVAAPELALRTATMELTARGVSIPSGIAVKGATRRPDVRIDHATIHELELDLVLPESAPPATEAEATAPRLGLRDDRLCRGERALIDLRDLDRLSGAIELGLAVHAQLPVVGTYSLARTFKIPVAEGTFDFIDVERQLSALEDAFIDFAVREGALILKRDIPILPTKGKTLVTWPLNPVEQALAQNRVIRLRTLARLQMASPKKGEGRATIKEVRIEEPHISLTLAPRAPGGGEAEGGPVAAISLSEIGTLSINGGLRYRGQSTDESNIRQLAAGLTARALRLALQDLDIAGRSIGLELGAAELEASVTEWSGFRPRRIHVRGREIELRNLALRGTARAR